MAGESKVAVAAALVGNGALAVLKGVAAALTGSASMLAETFHSIADTGNQALLLLGMRLGRQPPDEQHPFGHGKNVYFWAFVVSVMLFTLGGAFSIWEGVRHYLHPGERQSLGWAYGVIAGGVVFEVISFGVALRSLRAAKGNRSVRDYWRDTRDPTLITVVCEDAAALTSLLVAGAGITIGHLTGNGAWDALASGLIGVILLAVAVFLAFENYSLLLGETAPSHVEETIDRIVEEEPAVRAVRDLRTMHLGPHALLIVVAVDLAPNLDTAGVTAAISRLHRRLAECLGEVTNPRLIVIEPAADAGAAQRAA